MQTFSELLYCDKKSPLSYGTVNETLFLACMIKTQKVKQNEYFGNFHPYRANTISPESAEMMINTAGLRQTANNSVKKLRKRNGR